MLFVMTDNRISHMQSFSSIWPCTLVFRCGVTCYLPVRGTLYSGKN